MTVPADGLSSILVNYTAKNTYSGVTSRWCHPGLSRSWRHWLYWHRNCDKYRIIIKKKTFKTVVARDTVDGSTSECEAELEENRRLREARTCKVCMDREANTVFLPCGHLVCCDTCSPSLRNCAVCRALIRGTVKVFLGWAVTVAVCILHPS